MHFFYTSLTIITTTLGFALSWYYALNPTFESDNYELKLAFINKKIRIILIVLLTVFIVMLLFYELILF